MSILSKDITRILIESVQTEEFNTNPVLESDIENELMKEINYLEESQCDMIYTEEMIPVLMQETTFGNRYVVELDMLNKLMESYDIDAREALDRLCEHNEIEFADTYVMIESAEVIEESLKQYKKSSDLKSKEDIKNATKSIKDLQDKGIKLITKKAKAVKKKISKKCK